jgi:small GTP-binding protein
MQPGSDSLRVVLIGDASVGKTSLFNRLIEHRFHEGGAATVGASWHGYTTTVNGRETSFQIWDTAGQEKFRSLAPIYFRASKGAIVVFDVTNRKSFEAVGGWVATFKETAGPDAAVVIVGNKCDTDHRCVTVAEAQRWATDHRVPLFHASAKTGDGVEEPFRHIAAGITRDRFPARLKPESEPQRCGC